MRPLIAISVAAQLVSVSGTWAQVGPPSAAGGPPQAPAAAATIGERYADAIDRAWRGDGMGLGAAIGFEVFGRLHGQAHDEHRQVLLALLRHLGDARFALAMGGQDPDNHAVILRALRAAAAADSTGLSAAYPLTFGPRAPGDPPVEQCATMTAHRVLTPDRPMAASQDNKEVVLPPTAPPHVSVIIKVTASGRVDTSMTAVLSMPHVDSATTTGIKTTLASWRFVPASLRGCALPAWKNLELIGPRATILRSDTALWQVDSVHLALPTGLYVGPWDDAYSTHWLVLFVTARGKPFTYDPPVLVTVCGLRTANDSVLLQTGRMTEGSSGLDFDLLIRGSLTASGITGTARRVGRNMPESGPVPIQLTRFTMDTTAKGAHSRPSGLYASLRGVPETGDLLGDELLLVPSAGGLIALWTEYAGGPVGPYRADSVTVQGDSVRIVVNEYGLFTQRPLRPLARVFALSSTSLERSVKGALEKRATLQEFLSPQLGALRPPRCER